MYLIKGMHIIIQIVLFHLFTFINYIPPFQFFSELLYDAMVRDWQRKRPIWILLMLGSLTEENIRLRNIPLLDLFIDNAAEGLGKRVEAIESPQDQCKPLNKLSKEQVR